MRESEEEDSREPLEQSGGVWEAGGERKIRKRGASSGDEGKEVKQAAKPEGGDSDSGNRCRQASLRVLREKREVKKSQ